MPQAGVRRIAPQNHASTRASFSGMWLRPRMLTSRAPSSGALSEIPHAGGCPRFPEVAMILLARLTIPMVALSLAVGPQFSYAQWTTNGTLLCDAANNQYTPQI